ncbi:acetate kinase [Nakamurella sp. A5-74]|uniref:Acetate kinase n=1 Tax=Nakamurella sp. A5-74 TaxID=3158264 RepID=A0AAU8DRV9_9ACTN
MTDDFAAVLVINAGSSSLKYQLVQPVSGIVRGSGLIERIGGPVSELRHTGPGGTTRSESRIPDATAAFAAMVDGFAAHGPDLAKQPPIAVGHRVVHGGTRFSAATLVDAGVRTEIEQLVPLAPLHQPANLAGIDAAAALFPDLPQVAVFDTAFHGTIPPAAHTYAVPQQWREEYAVRRYGFHGTSHRWASGRAAALLGRADARMVVLHLGNGASACAVDSGRSVETSMGLTPLEGLVMGSRSGDIDPAIAGHLARVAGLSAEQIDTALNQQSGLRGLVGDNDFRELQDRVDAGDPVAQLAFDVVVHRLVKYVGAYAATLGRLDAVVFTGGIGENSAALRTAVVEKLALFGAVLDPTRDAGRGERIVSSPTSRLTVLVVPTDEERQIAMECVQL